MAVELDHRFTTARQIDDSFETILDLERVVPCVEGGRVVERTGPDAVDLALGCLLDQLPADPALWAALAERHEVRLSLSVSFEGWNKGFTLGPRTLQRVAALGVRLDVDLYASDHYPPELDRILNRP